MGSEFLRKQAASFKKRLDRSLLALGTPDLFTKTPTRAPRIVAAEMVGSPRVCPGDDLVLQKNDAGLVFLRGLTEIATLESPPVEVIELVDASFGCAKGIVEVVHDEASVLEISIC